MELTSVILGQLVTEKTERLKEGRTYTLRVAPHATKVDVQNALKKFFDVEPTSVRVLRVGAKSRALGTSSMVKRKPYKKALVTLSKNSKALDLAQFKAA